MKGNISAKAWTLRHLTSSDIRVAMDLPISWYLLWFPMGPSNINTNLVGTGTSVKSRRIMGCSSLTNVTTGWFRKSTSPTRMLAASAPGGIFFMKCRLCNIEDSFIIATLHVYKTGTSYGWQLGSCPNWMFVMLSKKKLSSSQDFATPLWQAYNNTFMIDKPNSRLDTFITSFYLVQCAVISFKNMYHFIYLFTY